MAMQSTPFRLDGLTALVTGGASGIGEAACRALAAAGASVIVADINGDRARTLAGELSQASVQVVDITNKADVDAVLGIMSTLDILVNNAGIGLVGNIEETSLDDFRRLFDVNVEGLYLVTKALLPALLRSQGTIVNVGSVAALVGVKRRFAYSATKGAVIALTRQLAIDYAGRLRVNCVAPGTVDTPFVEAYLQKFHSHELDSARAALRARHPMDRLAQPDEIASAILYLCSREAAFVTGSILTIDGGMTAA
jgi:NAD(P)-dependent dehydrogenase (short-subunit alcohol dehydrogenase family)